MFRSPSDTQQIQPGGQWWPEVQIAAVASMYRFVCTEDSVAILAPLLLLPPFANLASCWIDMEGQSEASGYPGDFQEPSFCLAIA